MSGSHVLIVKRFECKFSRCNDRQFYITPSPKHSSPYLTRFATIEMMQLCDRVIENFRKNSFYLFLALAGFQEVTLCVCLSVRVCFICELFQLWDMRPI